MKNNALKMPPEPSPEVKKEIAKDDKNMHQHMTEEQIDKILKDSFPASDPPSWY